MIRPSLVLAMFFLLMLGAAAGAEAAELFPPSWPKSPSIDARARDCT